MEWLQTRLMRWLLPGYREREATAKWLENSDVFAIDFDRCEIKNGSYKEEVEQKRSTYDTPAVDVHHTVTYIIYRPSIEGEEKQFLSQPFNADVAEVKFWIMEGR